MNRQDFLDKLSAVDNNTAIREFLRFLHSPGNGFKSEMFDEENWGDGNTMMEVYEITFPDDSEPIYVRVDGIYSSWGDSEWDSINRARVAKVITNSYPDFNEPTLENEITN